MSATMRAALVRAPGSPKDLVVEAHPVPVIGDDDVLVRVRAAGVQPADNAVLSGWAPPGSTAAFPLVPGNEVAGTVEATGAAVDHLRPGDEVLGFRVLGCHAELVAVPASQLLRRPEGLDRLSAGVLSASGQTAHTALERLEVRPGETLLVHGAAGGVGTMALQLARAQGVHVVGTASPANHDHVRRTGAIPVAYGDGQLERIRAAAPGGIDAVLDAGGRASLRTAVELVEDRRRIGSIVEPDVTEELGCTWIRSDRSTVRLGELADLCARGALTVTVRATYPLERAAEAHLDVESGHGRGKVALVVDED